VTPTPDAVDPAATSDGHLTLHADALAVLTSWVPGDDEQRSLRHSYLEFLGEHADAMWRECVEGHLTGSVLVLSHDRSHVLLTLHSKIKRWLQMGGHCEPGDTSMRAAAAREAHEESGISGLVLSDVPVRLDRHRVGCHGGSWDLSNAPQPFGTPGLCWHLDVQYVATAAAGAVEIMSDESLDLRWWPVDALPDDTDDALRALVSAARHTP
jgi:8-oxo-dGTP pyrophosphatase MutT (NUDIX family)